MKRKIDKEEVIRLWKDGMTRWRIAELLGVSLSTIQHTITPPTEQQKGKQQEHVRAYQKKNREVIREQQKYYKRQNILIIDGKSVIVNKRPRPDNVCELCHKESEKLDYHYWDKDKPHLGIWVCRGCRYITTAIDKDLHTTYLRFKEGIS